MVLRMKTQIAACICIALTQPCLGDETLFTCKDAVQHVYTAEGGREKPGWSIDKRPTDRVIKLILTDLAKTGSDFDIQAIGQHGKVSLLKDTPDQPCGIKEILDADAWGLDRAFVVTCRSSISTFLFYTRSGVPQLLETYLSLSHASTVASVTATKDCKPGD